MPGAGEYAASGDTGCGPPTVSAALSAIGVMAVVAPADADTGIDIEATAGARPALGARLNADPPCRRPTSWTATATAAMPTIPIIILTTTAAGPDFSRGTLCIGALPL